MLLAKLDNEVIFKKAFGDPMVFKAFVKDITGVEMDMSRTKIETEKRFSPKVGNIDFKLDIFAQDLEDRVTIEIQRVEYDYHFDRFLHYFLMTIAELQRTSSDYSIGKTVYTIIILTAKYTINQKNGLPIQDEVLISDLNPQNLKGDKLDIFGHKLFFLNYHYRSEDTPQAYNLWLDLIYQSIHNSSKPTLDMKNPIVKRVTDLISVDKLTPKELAASKETEGIKIAKILYENAAKEQGRKEGRKEGKKEGKKQAKIETIPKLYRRGLSLEDIAEVLDLPIKTIQNEIDKLSIKE